MASRYIGDLRQPYTPTRLFRSILFKTFACNTEVEPQVNGDRSFYQLLFSDFETPSSMTLHQSRTFLFLNRTRSKHNVYWRLYQLISIFFILLPLYIFSFSSSKCITVHIFPISLILITQMCFLFRSTIIITLSGIEAQWRIWRAKILTSDWKDTGLQNNFKYVLALLPDFLRDNNWKVKHLQEEVGLLPALKLYNAGSVTPRSVRENDCARFRSGEFVKDDMPVIQPQENMKENCKWRWGTRSVNKPNAARNIIVDIALLNSSCWDIMSS